MVMRWCCHQHVHNGTAAAECTVVSFFSVSCEFYTEATWKTIVCQSSTRTKLGLVQNSDAWQTLFYQRDSNWSTGLCELCVVRLLTVPHCCVVALVLGSCHSTSIFLGHDLRLRAFRKLRRLRWLRQHLLHLQPENPWGECTRKPWARRTHRWDLLPIIPFVIFVIYDLDMCVF